MLRGWSTNPTYNEHIFKYGFSDTINPTCARRTETETTEHFTVLKDKTF